MDSWQSIIWNLLDWWLMAESLAADMTSYLLIVLFCDNKSAAWWVYKLRMSKSISAACLFCILDICIYANQASSPLIPMNIAGKENCMADILSRAFKSGNFAATVVILQGYWSWFPCLLEQAFSHFTEVLLENVFPSYCVDSMHDFLSVWWVIGHCIDTKTASDKKCLKHWKANTYLWNATLTLVGVTTVAKNIMFTAFAAWVRTGMFRRWIQVSIWKTSKLASQPKLYKSPYVLQPPSQSRKWGLQTWKSTFSFSVCSSRWAKLLKYLPSSPELSHSCSFLLTPMGKRIPQAKLCHCWMK